MQQARALHQGTAKAARVFTGFAYTTRGRLVVRKRQSNPSCVCLVALLKMQ